MGMRWLRLRLGTLTYEDWLLFCFTAGIFCGTAAALAFGRSHGAGGVSWEQRAPSEAETGE